MRKSSFELESYSEGAIKIVLVVWVNHKADMQCSVCTSSLATVPYSLKNLIACFHFSSDVQLSITTVLLPQKFRICEFQLNCIELNVPRTNFSIKQPRGKNHEHYGTGPDQLYPRAFALRPNRVLLVLAIFKRVTGEKMLALRLRTSVT